MIKRNKLYPILLLILIISLLIILSGCPEAEPKETKPFVSQYNTLVWSDEFDSTTDPNIDASSWNIMTGKGSSPYSTWGWGNGEWQSYSNSLDNVKIENGSLIITALCSDATPTTSNITSGRVETRGKQEFQYGRISARIKAPTSGDSTGMWPAFWMLGTSFDSGTGWPGSGEIDIFEMSGPNNNTAMTTMHWDNNSGSPYPANHSYSGSSKIVSGNLGDKFRIYEVEWTTSSIKGILDGKVYHTLDITKSDTTEFHQDFYIILNLAVGSETGFVSYPLTSTTFPQTMEVDWVRVYQ